MAQKIPPDDTRPSRADADDVADAVVGVDTRIFTTIWDTVIHTPRVLQAAFDGDRDRYVPILRLFLILFGLQFALVAFMGIPSTLTLEQFDTEAARPVLEAWLNGQDAAAINLTLERTANLTNTIFYFIASLPYILLLKLYRPSRSYFGHLLAYLLATNASYLILLPLMAPGILGAFVIWYMIAMVTSLTVFFIAMGRVLHSHYTQKAWLLTLQLAGMIVLLPITLIIMIAAQFGTAELVVRLVHDRSFMEFFLAAAEANSP